MERDCRLRVTRGRIIGIMDHMETISFEATACDRMTRSSAPSAQTQRRGDASAGEGVAWRHELTGHRSLSRSISYASSKESNSFIRIAVVPAADGPQTEIHVLPSHLVLFRYRLLRRPRLVGREPKPALPLVLLQHLPTCRESPAIGREGDRPEPG